MSSFLCHLTPLQMTSGGLEYDDVMKALKFGRALEDGRAAAMPDAVKGMLKSLAGAVDKDTVEKIAEELASAGSVPEIYFICLHT